MHFNFSSKVLEKQKLISRFLNNLIIQAGLIGKEVITFDSLLDVEMQKGLCSTAWDFNRVALHTALFPASAMQTEALSSLIFQDS